LGMPVTKFIYFGRNGSMISMVGFCFKLSLGTVANGFHRY